MVVSFIMPSTPLPVALLMLLAAPIAPGAAGPRPPGLVGQMMFHQHIVIRIPRMPAPRPMTMPDPMLPPEAFHEKDGPQCVDSADLVAATIPNDDRVDIMLRGGERLRIRLDKRCRTLDYYTGFYVTAGHDGKVCAKRDSVRTRSGDDCGITKFRRLVPDN